MKGAENQRKKKYDTSRQLGSTHRPTDEKTTVYGGGPADGEEEEEEEAAEQMRRGKDSDGKAVEKTFDAKSFRIKSRETVFEETKKAKTTEMQIKPQLEKIKTMAKSLERQNLSNGPNAENEVYHCVALPFTT